jgi:acyl carrier protein
MKVDVHEVEALVTDALKAIREDLALPQLATYSPQTAIYGGSSGLDSMALVSLIADIEERLQQRYGMDWILADERAFSRQRSPFRDVASLSAFIVENTPS